MAAEPVELHKLKVPAGTGGARAASTGPLPGLCPPPALRGPGVDEPRLPPPPLGRDRARGSASRRRALRGPPVGSPGGARGGPGGARWVPAGAWFPAWAALAGTWSRPPARRPRGCVGSRRRLPVPLPGAPPPGLFGVAPRSPEAVRAVPRPQAPGSKGGNGGARSKGRGRGLGGWGSACGAAPRADKNLPRLCAVFPLFRYFPSPRVPPPPPR